LESLKYFGSNSPLRVTKARANELKSPVTKLWVRFCVKAIHSQKLHRPETGKADAYADLQLILSKPIDWELVRHSTTR
jgi:hypothetical protein